MEDRRVNEPLGERPSYCERCGERPVNLQIYPLRPINNEWICSRHPEYRTPAQYPTERQTPGPMTNWDV